MTPEAFKLWRLARFPTQGAAAEALGVSRDRIIALESGQYRSSKGKTGAKAELSLTERLAMCAWDRGVADYDGETETRRRRRAA